MNSPIMRNSYPDEEWAWELWANEVAKDYKKPPHSDPELFNKTRKWAQSRRKAYLKDKLDKLQAIASRLNRKSPFFYFEADENNKEQELIRKKIYDKGSVNLDIERIKEIPIVDYLANEGVKIGLEQSNRAKCRCPIHEEKTASFVIYKDTNSFFCFGCSEGGSIIDLYMKINKVEIKEALKNLNKLTY